MIMINKINEIKHASQLGLISVSSSTHVENLLKAKWQEQPRTYRIHKRLNSKQEDKLKKILKTNYTGR